MYQSQYTPEPHFLPLLTVQMHTHTHTRYPDTAYPYPALQTTWYAPIALDDSAEQCRRQEPDSSAPLSQLPFLGDPAPSQKAPQGSKRWLQTLATKDKQDNGISQNATYELSIQGVSRHRHAI